MRKLLSIFTLFALVAVGVTTASAQKLRVMSYNVKNGIGEDDIKSIRRCADVIRKAQPDVVAIQELDSCTRRNNFYVLGRMAEQTGYNAYFAPAINYAGGKYGIGILSKEKAISMKYYPLPNNHEARCLLVVEFKKYYMLCTHLSGVPQRLGRGIQVDIIRDVVSKLKNKPVFIAGDTNARPTSAPMMAFKEFCEVLSDETKMTAPSSNPSKCIDYILGANGSFTVLNQHVEYGCLASDHLPIWVDVKISKAKKTKK